MVLHGCVLSDLSEQDVIRVETTEALLRRIELNDILRHLILLVG